MWGFRCGDSCVGIPVWVSCVGIPVQGFLGGDFCVVIPVGFLCRDSCVGIPVWGFLCRDSCVEIPVWRFLWGIPV